MAASAIYRFAGIEVNPSQGCLRRQGQEQYPRSKVFQVLLYLLAHRDRVVAKEELIEHVWKGAAVTDDVVFRCIAEIRTLLGDSRESAHFVRTFPAAGYRFVAAVEEERAGQNSPDSPGGSKNSRPPDRSMPRWMAWATALLLLTAPTLWLGVRYWRVGKAAYLREDYAFVGRYGPLGRRFVQRGSPG